jgi:hypothetical protein
LIEEVPRSTTQACLTPHVSLSTYKRLSVVAAEMDVLQGKGAQFVGPKVVDVADPLLLTILGELSEHAAVPLTAPLSIIMRIQKLGHSEVGSHATGLLLKTCVC